MSLVETNMNLWLTEDGEFPQSTLSKAFDSILFKFDFLSLSQIEDYHIK